MSDTEIELEPQVPPSRRQRHQPSSPADEPAGEASADDVGRNSSVAPGATTSPSTAAESESVAEPTVAPATPRRRAPRATGVGFPWEVSPLAQFPMAELLAEIDRRHARARALLAERERIVAQMAALEAEMGVAVRVARSVSPAAGPAHEARPRRQRAKNTISLADALAQAVEVRATVSPAEAAQLVLSNGYQSTAKNFGMVVANALAKDARFTRVERGRYERVAQ